MKHRVICLVIVICLFVAGCGMSAAIGEGAHPVAFFGNVADYLNDASIRQFLETRGILADDREAYDYADAFFALAVQKDVVGMKGLFAPNAISEIGEDRLDEMLEGFVDYFDADSFTLEMPIGPSTSERWDHGMRSKELAGPLELMTDDNAYRLAIKCVACDDWDTNNVGIWSIYIIERSMDTDLEHPYIGDKAYRTGIYINVGRPD